MREQCLSGGATGRTEAMLRRSFHPRRSGDVLFALEPYNIEGRSPARTANLGNATRTFPC